MSEEGKKGTRELLTEQFLHILESDHPFSWVKCWEISGRPINAVSGRRYRGINHLYLKLIAQERRYQDPRWCTYKQATEKGWRIKKGEHGEKVEFWYLFDQKEKKSLTFEEAREIVKQYPEKEADFQLAVRHFIVFNGEQIEGIPEYKTKRHTFDRFRIADQFLLRLSENLGVALRHGGDRAYYSPLFDTICLPEPERFFTAEDYYSTALHEFSHATGHVSRLNRNIQHDFGDEKYAVEELRAEISSVFLSAETQIPISERQIKNHMAYVQSWIAEIRDKPAMLFAAIKDAEKMADYLIDQGELKACIEEVEKDAGRERHVKEERQYELSCRQKSMEFEEEPVYE